MRIAIIIFLVFGTYSTWSFLPAQQATEITSGQVSFNFVSKDVDGTIGGFTSKSRIDLENLEDSVFEGSVSVTTLDTNNGLRNWSLKGRKYFDEDDHPKIYFKSNEIIIIDNGLIVKGMLTLKGTSKPITIDFKKQGKSLIGSTSLYSSDFGIKIKKERKDNLVKVRMVFELE